MRQLFSSILFLTLIQGCVAVDRTKKDDFFWLEDIKSVRSIKWVKEQNNKTTTQFGSGERFKKTRDTILGTYNSPKQFNNIFFIGDEIAQIIKKTDTSKGFLKSITFEESKKPNPVWKNIIDFDLLSAQESKDFVFGSTVCNLLKIKQCLIGLSIKGADNVEYREYNLITRSFVNNGFVIPKGNTNVSWVDSNTIMFASSFKGESTSIAGYGTTLKLWKRGTKIEQAETLLHIKKGDGIDVRHNLWEGKSYILIQHWLDFYNGNIYFYKNERLSKINVPTSHEAYGVHRGFAILKLYKEWCVDGKVFASGSLVGVDLESKDLNQPKIELIFEQNKHQSFDSVNITKSNILLNVLVDMKTKLLSIERLGNPQPGLGWRAEYIQKPSNNVLRIRAVSPALDEAILGYRGFLTPNSLFFLNAAKKTHRLWVRNSRAFETKNLKFSTHFVKGEDGVEIPYQMVGLKELDEKKRYPVIIYVYGAYGQPTTAWYSSILGKEWLTKGGVFVIANTRGGGAYGEHWHQAAIRTTKHKTTDDVATIAKDLIRRKITTPEKLGVMGQSLGGLAACSVITKYSNLFKAAVCKTALTDLIRYTKLFSGAFWISELGDPSRPEERKYLLKHSPYHAVKKESNIPPMLFITYKNDDRVHPGHARRMVAKMQAVGLEAYLYESPEGGHNGATTKAERAKIKALEYEYFKQRLFD